MSITVDFASVCISSMILVLNRTPEAVNIDLGSCRLEGVMLLKKQQMTNKQQKTFGISSFTLFFYALAMLKVIFCAMGEIATQAFNFFILIP